MNMLKWFGSLTCHVAKYLKKRSRGFDAGLDARWNQLSFLDKGNVYEVTYCQSAVYFYNLAAHQKK